MNICLNRDRSYKRTLTWILLERTISNRRDAGVSSSILCVLFSFFLYMSQVRDALEQFDNALELNPNPTEAQAAFYNKACCHAYR